MNLEEELLLQFHAVRALQTTVISDESLPLNQRAAVANSVASILNRLIELQDTVYNQERFKTIEATLIRCLREMPEEAAQKFIEIYETSLAPGST